MSERQPAFDDQLPWLQEVEDEDAPSGVSARKMLALLLVVLLGAALVAGSFFWLGQRDAGEGAAPELIQAPPGPYKVKPADPGGLDVTGESETAFQTSAGEDRDSRLNLEALPERAAEEPVDQEPQTAAPSAPQAAEPAAPSGAPGTVIQLGAFGNSAQAERAWAALSARFPGVAALNKMLVPYPGGIRLRAGAASAAEAREACKLVQAGGEACFIAR